MKETLIFLLHVKYDIDGFSKQARFFVKYNTKDTSQEVNIEI